jgi:hypothetical protein
MDDCDHKYGSSLSEFASLVILYKRGKKADPKETEDDELVKWLSYVHIQNIEKTDPYIRYEEKCGVVNAADAIAGTLIFGPSREKKKKGL